MAKIVIIGPSEKYASGIANYTWRMINELAATPTLYRNMLPRILFPGNERIGKVSSKIYYNNATYLDWYNLLSWIRGILSIRKCDLFIVEWWSCSVAHMLLFICLLSGRRFVIEAHEILDPMEQKSLLLNAYARLCRYVLFNKASAIVVHNQQDLSLICDKYKKVSVIPHAVYDQFKVDPEEHKTLNILFFGLIREYKGVEVLLTSFEALKLPYKTLYIIGENWDHIPIPERNDICYINKYVSDEDAEFYFNQADVLVLPYTRGSASGVAAIGIHYGLPIIASRVDGIYEQLYDYEGVMWIDPGDDFGLTQWLYSVALDNRKKRYNVPERLQWTTIKRQWEELCQNLK
jgi:glycosyltransferase involved in cell wall biosynthesis